MGLHLIGRPWAREAGTVLDIVCGVDVPSWFRG